MMRRDQHGLPLTAASTAAVEHYDRAVDHLVHFRSAVDESAAAALGEDPAFPMGAVLAAYLRLLSTEADDAVAANAAFADFRRTTELSALLPRERAHVDAVQALVDGDLGRAGSVLRQLTYDDPRDLLALAVGHQIDFFTGDATTLRDRVGSVLTVWSDADPHRATLLGMYAFGLEETGDYARSEDVGLAGVAADAKNVWGIHAVVHSYEMRARFGDGIRFMDERRSDWSEGNFFAVHNSWHYALYALEAGALPRVLEIYDEAVHPAGQGVAAGAMDLVDASALLWRLYLEGDEQPERWAHLADEWRPKMAEAHYAFNDVHAVMSYAGAGDLAAAEALVKDRQEWLQAPHPGRSNHRMTAEIGLPVCRALLAFSQGRYADVVELLHPIRQRINEFGGSHAQRDAVQRTLLEASTRAGHLDLARALVSERIFVRPCSPYNHLAHARVLRAVGADEAAAAEDGLAATYRGQAAVSVAR